MFKSTLNIAVAIVCSSLVTLTGCEPKVAQSQVIQPLETPIVIEHNLGQTVISNRPQRVAALDMNEVDFLDQLNVPIAGMVKDFVPHFLEKYKNTPDISDLGAIVQPNMEKIYALKPDLVLMTPLHANQYEELSKLAPTVHFDIDFRNSHGHHVDIIKQHVIDLGEIFNKQTLAQKKVAEIDAKVDEVQALTAERSEKALVVMHNNGSFSSFGIESRYGFVFDVLGVKPASTEIAASLHGQPISSEFINQANPDILYIIDRTAVMEGKPVIDAEHLANPLLRQTKAWKNGKVIFVDADAWYITSASITSLKIVIDDIIKGYQS
ncbi:ferric anguibactin-binding protein (plasmid) [Vibrio anguillarum]|uniref:Ferric-anguibactin-binding protein FatB n=16 Tax=Vibrio anguillarum TaxID=55601 RepID=FATB_VIBA7|nr:siderophore ABC transporter substrate-binding protein [Vibrio anguillarum]P11460.1 RecName: Full=Ferric-anguibactin-binding protein FatB; Flags: Precursor [Vibrio anguillarum 775]AAO92376.1 iron transport protein [Vibrio anguillarum]AAR12526.1 ferric anguibactin transport protein [Vibrio anguillarum 775]AGU59964.1 ferric anguibactin-binding protein [Vibrio anguillarum M3]ATA51766.1 ferric anguibactin-binding protein [Vibrio anguillarum]AVT65663.1 ferric anguibactin-binding protein [Vibrio 